MIYRSVMHNQTEILHAVMHLHNKGRPFELDPCFSKGSMYKSNTRSIELPSYRYDINPSTPGVSKASADALPLPSSCISSMVLDPPWLIHAAGKTKMTDRFGHFGSKKEMVTSISDFLKEGYRVLHQDGILLFKCQDFIHDRRKFFMSIFFVNRAISMGFNVIDHLLFLPKSRIRSNALDQCISYGSHSWHTHFYVFRKKRTRTKYLGNYNDHV